MLNIFLSRTLLAVALVAALAGCKSDAEWAEENFQSGVALLQSGDVERAMIHFRNVFEFDPEHLPAREVLARHFMSEGNRLAAYGQYRAIAEQNPEHFEARRALAELSFATNNWDEFERHGAFVVVTSPEDPRVQAIDLGLKYRAAALEEDVLAMQALVAPAEALLSDQPESQILNSLLIDSYARDGALSKALTRLDVLLSLDPDNRQLYTRRLALLQKMEDLPALETQLKAMVEQFPGDNEVYGMLLRYYVAQQRLDEAEAFLREIADPADEDPGLFLSLIQFVSQTKGDAAARAEIERAIAANPKPDRFKAMRALLDFQAGQQEPAIAEMEAILADADPAEAQTQTIKISLAKMLVGSGNPVGARRQVEEVLAQNPSQVEALKMQASWHLQVDEIEAAIANLRIALDTAPEDIQAMNLMHEAYTRAGETDLAREYLAQAVEASGNAPTPTLRYARVLMGDERYLPAEDALLSALRRGPENVDILTLLGQLYLRMDDIPRATQVIDTLRRIDTEETRSIANGLQADLLIIESGTEQALDFLENLAGNDTAEIRDQVRLLSARLQVGDTEAALEIARKLVEENPDDLGLKRALANTQAAGGDLAAAETTLREITAAAPQAPEPWLSLARLAQSQGEYDASAAIIEEGLVATDRNADIVWAKASILERQGDIDAAIALYEELYAKNSGSVILANNLASLLATYKDDAESLERAWIVGRRLRDADHPALQDTYGWILYRRGDAEAALPYLESAAEKLDDPIVQAHLGFVYAALERNEAALAQMQKAVDLAGPADTRAKVEEARSEIPRLRGLLEN